MSILFNSFFMPCFMVHSCKYCIFDMYGLREITRDWHYTCTMVVIKILLNSFEKHRNYKACKYFGGIFLSGYEEITKKSVFVYTWL